MKISQVLKAMAATSLCALVFVVAVGCSGAPAASSSGASTSASAASSAAPSAVSSAASAASSTSASSESSSAAGASSSSAAGAGAETTLTAEDLANVDITIDLDDFDGMKALSNDIQNGRATGQVVKIDGYVNNFAKGMSYSIVERNADNTANQGTVFVVEGVEEDEYPSDGTHVILTGKVVANDGVMFTIHTLPEFIEVVD